MLFCSCESDALTLMRLRYWPGTPTRPLVAFSFALMDWMEALLLECQVAVQDFATALEAKIRGMFKKLVYILSLEMTKHLCVTRNDFYFYSIFVKSRCRAIFILVLIDAFEEYRLVQNYFSDMYSIVIIDILTYTCTVLIY